MGRLQRVPRLPVRPRRQVPSQRRRRPPRIRQGGPTEAALVEKIGKIPACPRRRTSPPAGLSARPVPTNSLRPCLVSRFPRPPARHGVAVRRRGRTGHSRSACLDQRIGAAGRQVPAPQTDDKAASSPRMRGWGLPGRALVPLEEFGEEVRKELLATCLGSCPPSWCSRSRTGASASEPSDTCCCRPLDDRRWSRLRETQQGLRRAKFDPRPGDSASLIGYTTRRDAILPWSAPSRRSGRSRIRQAPPLTALVVSQRWRRAIAGQPPSPASAFSDSPPSIPPFSEDPRDPRIRSPGRCRPRRCARSRRRRRLRPGTVR